MGFFLAVVTGILWLIASRAAQYTHGPTFLLWPGLVGAIATLVLISALWSWSRQIRILRSGDLASAEVLAVHLDSTVYKRADNWRRDEQKEAPSKHEEVQDQLQDLRKRWKTNERQELTRNAWNGVGSCVFRFRLPDDSIVVTSCIANLVPRLAKRNYSANDVALYNPATPEFAFLLSTFDPPLQTSTLGEWQIASHASKPSLATFLIVLLCWIALIILFMIM